MGSIKRAEVLQETSRWPCRGNQLEGASPSVSYIKRMSPRAETSRLNKRGSLLATIVRFVLSWSDDILYVMTFNNFSNFAGANVSEKALLSMRQWQNRTLICKAVVEYLYVWWLISIVGCVYQVNFTFVLWVSNVKISRLLALCQACAVSLSRNGDEGHDVSKRQAPVHVTETFKMAVEFLCETKITLLSAFEDNASGLMSSRSGCRPSSRVVSGTFSFTQLASLDLMTTPVGLSSLPRSPHFCNSNKLFLAQNFGV